jgi:hypothetical protein
LGKSKKCKRKKKRCKNENLPKTETKIREEHAGSFDESALGLAIGTEKAFRLRDSLG